MQRDDFQLSANSTAHYLKLFDEADFRVTKKLEGNDTAEIQWTGRFEAVLEIGQQTDDISFEICADVEGPSVPNDVRELARSVVSSIIEMDHAARSIPDVSGHSEHLASVQLAHNEVRFCYWATTVNTEWDVVFEFNAPDNWRCIGIPDWRNPGTYIR